MFVRGSQLPRFLDAIVQALRESSAIRAYFLGYSFRCERSRKRSVGIRMKRSDFTLDKAHATLLVSIEDDVVLRLNV